MTYSTVMLSPTYSLDALVQQIEGATLLGPCQVPVTGLCHPRLWAGEGDMIYVGHESVWAMFAQNHVRLGLVEASLAIPPAVQARIDQQEVSLLVVPRGRVALAVLLQCFERRAWLETGIHPTAMIHPTAQLAADVSVGAFTTVGPNAVLETGVCLYSHVSIGADVQIGEDSILYAGVRIGDRCVLGKRCILQPNAVIGADGFSYVTPKEARHEKKASHSAESLMGVSRINSIGNVVLEDDVEVGACTCVDRGTLAETRIAKGTKLDNLTQIGHNNQIGQHCLIVSQVGISGSCKIGNGVVIAGQTGVADHLNIGDNVIIMARSGVMKDIEAGAVVLGAPAIPHKEAMANIAASLKIRDMAKALKAMQAKVKDFEALAAQVEAFSHAFSSDETRT
ncbi:MAG: UDP-3-O-(3-hydroxymyristoyl)glucosamine N-acyltransferase [Vampirovibrio sp.]